MVVAICITTALPYLPHPTINCNQQTVIVTYGLIAIIKTMTVTNELRAIQQTMTYELFAIQHIVTIMS